MNDDVERALAILSLVMRLKMALFRTLTLCLSGLLIIERDAALNETTPRELLSSNAYVAARPKARILGTF